MLCAEIDYWPCRSQISKYHHSKFKVKNNNNFIQHLHYFLFRLFFFCTYGYRMFTKFSVIRSDISDNLCTLYFVQLRTFLHQYQFLDWV